MTPSIVTGIFVLFFVALVRQPPPRHCYYHLILPISTMEYCSKQYDYYLLHLLLATYYCFKQ